MSVRALQAAAAAAVSSQGHWKTLENLEEALAEVYPTHYRNKLKEVIEKRWLARAEAQMLGKPTSMKYQRAELEYFIGAMAALDAVFPNTEDPSLVSPMVPPSWVFNTMMGKNVTEVPGGR